MNVLICDILIRVSSVELSGVFSAVFKYATLDMTLNSTIFNTNILYNMQQKCKKKIMCLFLALQPQRPNFFDHIL